MKISYLFTFLLAVVFLASCNRDNEDPVITITSPTENLEVKAGEVFSLKAKVTDNEALKLIDVKDDNGSILPNPITTFDKLESHELNYNVTINSESDPGDLNVTIEATDQEDNTAIKSVVVKIVN